MSFSHQENVKLCLECSIQEGKRTFYKVKCKHSEILVIRGLGNLYLEHSRIQNILFLTRLDRVSVKNIYLMDFFKMVSCSLSVDPQKPQDFY